MVVNNFLTSYLSLDDDLVSGGTRTRIFRLYLYKISFQRTLAGVDTKNFGDKHLHMFDNKHCFRVLPPALSGCLGRRRDSNTRPSVYETDDQKTIAIRL